MKLTPLTIAVTAGALGLGLAALFVWRRGVAGAASDVAGAAVSAVGGVASGTVGAIGSSVGLPTPSETTTDPRVARYVIDRAGYLAASKWAGAGALWDALFLAEGSGTPPPAGTPLATFLAGLPAAPAQASYDETDRLLNRYPAPVAPAADYGFGGWG